MQIIETLGHWSRQILAKKCGFLNAAEPPDICSNNAFTK